MLGHSWGAWTVTTPATSNATGVETRICINDATHVETRTIPALGGGLTGGDEFTGGGPIGGGPTGGVTIIEDEETPLFGPFPAFINGFSNNTFRGNESMTREQFVTILHRLKGSTVSTEEPTFKDVAVNRWSYDAIEWAVDSGIIEANAQGNFRPSENITRAEMAVMLVKADALTEKANNTFTDVEGHSAQDDILKAVHAGIFMGYGDRSFRPDNSATRYEVVASLVRYLLGGEPSDKMWEGHVLKFSDVPSGTWAYAYVTLSVSGNLPESV